MEPEFLIVVYGGRTVVARAVRCSLCEEVIPIPLLFDTIAIQRLCDAHILAKHVGDPDTELLGLLPSCARCKRVLASGAPHRPCYLAECSCPCSYPAKESLSEA